MALEKELVRNFHEPSELQAHIYASAAPHYRRLVWREDNYDPYHILVSEVMLQQTQVARVQLKFVEFIARFPTIESLAAASLRDVLAAWSGLGYNRRGLYLQQAAAQIVALYGGHVPANPQELVQLPGIGPNTAGSIAAFAYQLPTVFIETNIRTVFLHTCFSERIDVCDRELMPLIAQTVDLHNPRAWYYALMDYGSYLKRMLPNPSRRSKQHVVQSRFEGSDRQIRGAIVRHLAEHGSATSEELLQLLPHRVEQATRVLERLLKERFVVCTGAVYHIAAEL